MKITPARRKNFSSSFLLFVFSFICSTFLLSTPQLHAQDQPKEKIKEVKIAGNLRVEEDGIRLHLKNHAGDIFDPALVEQDVKAIYRMGFFDNVKADLSPEGVLTYTVKEKPYIKEVKIEGNSQVSRDKIETALGITARTVLDRSKLAEGIDKVRKLYGEQGYVNADVDYAVKVEGSNQATVLVDIKEGTRLLIKKISFEGNHAFTDGDLKSLMATKEKWMFSFITNRGVLDRDVLTNDIAVLSNHYYDNGFIDHKIDEPIILKDRDGLEVVIRITEGEQYRVGKVEIGGDLIEDGRQLLKHVKITPGQIFRGGRLRDDITTLTNMYSNKGYAFVQVDPVTKVNAAQKTVDVQLLIAKGPPVYFNRVLIAGNTKTRDKVVRRELLATEQELYSGAKVTQSKNALQRTGYFEDVNITTKKTSQPDAVDMLVDVKEGPTGNFSVGAGYASGDGFLFNSSVAEKNLMGRGQGVNGSFSLGSKRQDFTVGYTDPYFRDTNVSMGLNGYNTRRDFTDFNEKQLGFDVNTSYPLKKLNVPFFGPMKKPDSSIGSDELASAEPITMWDFMRGGMSYELMHEDITGISKTAPREIQAEKGTSLTSSMTPSISYDSRDHYFNPTEGMKSSLSTKFAGLGGDTRFLKADLSAHWYYPLLKDPSWGGAYVLGLGGSLGRGFGISQNDLPLFERYFVGGINSVRGFTNRTIGPRTKPVCVSDKSTAHNVYDIGTKLNSKNCHDYTNPLYPGDTYTYSAGDVIGGNNSAVFNTELMFPIAEQYGLRGVAFFDVGNAWNGGFNFSDFRRSVGVGARWLSPFGPLRVELGFPLNKLPHDETSVLGFSVGSQP